MSCQEEPFLQSDFLLPKDPELSFGEQSITSGGSLCLPNTPDGAASLSDYEALDESPVARGAPSRGQKYCVPHVGTSSLLCTVSNVVLAVLGAGQLTLPYAFSQLGIGFGVAALIGFTLSSIHSCYVLSVHALHYQPSRKYCLESYSELVVRVLGTLGERLCTFMITVYAWGGGIGFLMILKGELAYLAQRVGLAGTLFHMESGKVLMMMVSCVIIWPLSSLYCVSKLKIFAPVACCAAIFIMIVVVLCMPWSDLESCSGPAAALSQQTNAGTMKWSPDSLLDVAAALPLLAFALNSTWAFVPILCTLRQKTHWRVEKLIGYSNGIIVFNYLFLSCCGYYMFCGATDPNILVSLGKYVDPHSWQGYFVCVARVALAFQLTIGLPMRFFVTRRAMGGGELPRVSRVCMTGCIVWSAVAIAALDLSLAFVLGVVSSICASMIIYIMPAAIDIINNLKGRCRKLRSWLSLLIGLFIMIGGLVANFMGVAKGS